MADETDTILLTAEVVASFVGKNHIRPTEVPDLIASVHTAIVALSAPQPAPADEAPAQSEHEPAVSVRKSLSSPDHIISMIDGKPYRTLKRHLKAHGLSPDDYRQRFGLKSDYPMVAKTYSEARRAMAKALGLGRKAIAKVEAAVGMEPAEAPAPKRRGRKPKGAGGGAAQAS